MDRYAARINAHGTTPRERHINHFKKRVSKNGIENPSSKSIKLNGKDDFLFINSGTQPYYKEFESYPGQNINIGDYVEWAHSHWLVYRCDSDDELYKDGDLFQCNYLLRWQNENGDIIERWAVIESASKYNDGTTGDEFITVGSDQLSVWMGLDDEILKLKKSMGIKFFIDHNTEDPTTYELTGTGNVPDTYDGHGCTSWIVKECAYTASGDDLLYGVCNYKHPLGGIEPDPPTGNSVISGSVFLKTGFPRTYYLKNAPTDFEWNVVSDFEVIYSINDDKIELMVTDQSAINQRFFLRATKDDVVLHEIIVTVTD